MDLATRVADTAFADLICADPQWLREEFGALIAATFSRPPAPPPPAPPRVRRAADPGTRPLGRGPVSRRKAGPARTPNMGTTASVHLRYDLPRRPGHPLQPAHRAARRHPPARGTDPGQQETAREHTVESVLRAAEHPS